jgi:hypothetical protein
MPRHVGLLEDYRYRLERLSGDAFETAVIADLSSAILSLNPISRKPSGDGGVDALSHQNTTAYCCYGLDLTRSDLVSPPKTGSRVPDTVVDDVVRKFTSDLRRIFELKSIKGTLQHADNPKLEDVLSGSTGKISTIRLIVNIENNLFNGRLGKAMAMCKKHSKMRFVEDQCNLVIWAPTYIANLVDVKPHLIARLECAGFSAAVTQAAKAPIRDASSSKLRSKCDDLKARKMPATRVDKVEATWSEGWSKALSLAEELSNNAPDLHQEFERARCISIQEAERLSLASGSDPLAMCKEILNGILPRIQQVAKGLPIVTRDEIASWELGYLIGECPLDWRATDD